MPWYAFLKRNWLGILGLLVGVAGISLSIMFYTRTLAERDPAFVVGLDRTEIIRADRVSGAPLKVVKGDGTEISGDISSVKMYFWNRGKLPIKPEHVLQPIYITLQDERADILDFQVVGYSRDVVDPQVTRSASTPRRSLAVSFRIMEQNDGLCLQVIYSGDPTANFGMTGRIEGVAQPIGSESIARSRFWSVYLGKVKTFSVVLIILIVAGFVIAAFKLISWPVERKLRARLPHLGDWLLYGRVAVWGIVLLWLVGWMLFIKPVKDSRQEARQSLAESVPPCILKGATAEPMATRRVESDEE